MFYLSRTLSTAFVTYHPWSELRKSEKNLYQFSIKKLGVRVIHECALYLNKYGNNIKLVKSIHIMS